VSDGLSDVAEFPWGERLEERARESAGAAPGPAACDSSVYLDIAERIVRAAAAWQGPTGAIIDPNTGEEWSHTSPRYASAVAPLVAAGRCEDLVESCARCLDASCRAIAEEEGGSTDFWPRDLALAIECLEGKVDAGRSAEWRRLLGGYDPQHTYRYVTSKVEPKDIHNWCIYSLTGEQMKRRLGIADNLDFIEDHLETQRPRFTAAGMYRDPNCPTTYDLTVRQNLGMLLRYGYDGRHCEFVDEMLRRGGLAQLFFQSTTGEMPFGGRSNQFHHVEAMAVCTAEHEASRYAALGDAALAGAFKRSARRAAAATLRWQLEAEPFRHIKNMFDPAELHGCDSYGHLSVYSLLAADLFAYAGLIADESIEEGAAPCDAGGFVLPVLDDFHRVFASCGPLHLQIDTCGQAGFDATGLGRLHHRDRPSETALSVGIVPKPHYRTSEKAHAEAVAIGPCWRGPGGEWRSLAGEQPRAADVEILEESPSRAAFRVRYDADRQVVEEYVLTPEGLEVSASVGAGPVRLTVPLIVTDGEATSSVREEAHAFVMEYRGITLRVEVLDEDATCGRLGVQAPNRNGIYDVGCFERAAAKIRARLSFL